MTISDLGDAHGTALTALLDVLRDRAVDDTAARTRAVDLAVTALVDLRSRADLERALTEERAGDAFDRLAESLRRVLRGRDVRLDLGTPGAEEGADRVLPTEVASTASTVVRSAVHAMLDDQRQRIRHLRTLPERDQEGFTSMSVSTYWLTDDEVADVRRELDRLLKSYRGDRPVAGEGRRRVAVTYSVLPVVES